MATAEQMRDLFGSDSEDGEVAEPQGNEAIDKDGGEAMEPIPGNVAKDKMQELFGSDDEDGEGAGGYGRGGSRCAAHLECAA